MHKNLRTLFWVSLLGVLAVALSGCLFTPSEGGIISLGRPYELVNMGQHGGYNDPDLVKLTDGKVGNVEVWDDPYAGFNAIDGAQPSCIVVDLGAAKTVSSVSIHCYHGKWGIYAPKKIYTAISNDKVNWSELVYHNVTEEDWNPEYADQNPGGAWYSMALSGTGRYVKVGFENFGWAWASEISVIEKN